MLMDVLIIVSVSIMPLINISTIAHFINDVQAEDTALTTGLSQLILELSKHLSADTIVIHYLVIKFVNRFVQLLHFLLSLNFFPKSLTL